MDVHLTSFCFQLTKLSVICDDDLPIVKENASNTQYPLRYLYIKTVMRQPSNEHIVNFMRFCREFLTNLEEIWVMYINSDKKYIIVMTVS